MSLNRRDLLTFGAMTGGVLAAAQVPALAATASVADPEVADNGLFAQPWFLESFMELNDDLTSAADEGKFLAILFEQRGCPYCRELHRVNFAKKEIRSYLDANFHVLQLDMWGDREVTDFDGKAMPEKEIAQRWAVNFTPTMVFFPNDPAVVKGKTGRQVEVARMPGYFKPFHFISMLEYVRTEKYAGQHFQRFLQDKFKQLEAEGKKPEVW